MKRNKPQKHQNKTTYKVQFKQHLIDLQENTPKDHLCKRCYEIIDWKLKYGKYKKLTVPGKCQKCQKKNILKSYRHNCEGCSSEFKICSKCSKPIEEFETHVTPKKIEQVKNNEMMMKMKNHLKRYREVSRRKLYRLMDEDLIIFKNDKFVYRDTELEVEELQLMKKYREDLDGDGDEDEDEDQFSDDSGSYKQDD
jgi:hypothetical protein